MVLSRTRLITTMPWFQTFGIRSRRPWIRATVSIFSSWTSNSPENQSMVIRINTKTINRRAWQSNEGNFKCCTTKGIEWLHLRHLSHRIPATVASEEDTFDWNFNTIFYFLVLLYKMIPSFLLLAVDCLSDPASVTRTQHNTTLKNMIKSLVIF